jgi:SAM-dependent methyltransferase
MVRNKTNFYNIDSHAAEIYDQIETQQDDVALIRELIGKNGRLRILEPFCGTGRILTPLAEDGHEIVGMDSAGTMLGRAKNKIYSLPFLIWNKITLLQVDVLTSPWLTGFDLVILGGNCFCELAIPEDQEIFINRASQSLVPGGFVFIDIDHMEGELAEDWRMIGSIQLAMNGICRDGASVESTRETIWCDAPRRLIKYRRWIKVIRQDGEFIEEEIIQQKHPVSVSEIQGWLENNKFVIDYVFGNYVREPYFDASRRAVCWAHKPNTHQT